MARPTHLLLVLAVAFTLLVHANPSTAMEPYWIEPAFEPYPLKGPAAALGLVIWNHGVKGNLPEHQYPPPPLIQGLATRGWDVVKLNRNPLWENTWSNAGQRHVERLIEEVAAARVKGYGRIILAGQSYGGAIALTAAGAIDGLWGVIATAPSTGQAVIEHQITDRWSESIARDTYNELRSLRRTRTVLVFPNADEYVNIPRGSTARTIFAEKAELPFLLVDEAAPIRGHVGAYSAEFNPYASCVEHFVDPAIEPRAGEFRCFRDEFPAISRTIRAVNSTALATQGATWFGYYAKSGQELVLTVRETGTTAPLVEYAWGPGVLAKFKPGAVTAQAEREGENLLVKLSNGAIIRASTAADGKLLVVFTKNGQAPLTATLLPVER
jgi:pimeloyl-ACP methyl ester carboxylesterase